MGTKLARDGNAASARIAEKPDAAGRTQMLAMNASATELGQQDVAHNHELFPCSWPARQSKDRTPMTLVHHTVAHEIVVLAVVEHGEVKHGGILDRAAHQFMILYTMGVIGDRNDAEWYHRSNRRHFFAGKTSGDRTGSKYVDAGGLPCPIQNPGYSARIVGGRTGVGHADNGSKSTRRRCLTAGRDGFFMRLARLAKMNMHVDQSGSNDQAFSGDCGCAFPWRRGLYFSVNNV